MDNVWFVDDNCPLVTWSAILPTCSQLGDLLTLTQEVVRYGVVNRVLVPVSLPRYEAHGSGALNQLIDGLANRFQQGEVDLLDFAGFGSRHQGNLLRTHIGVANRDGVVCELMAACVKDLPPSLWRSEDGTPDVIDSDMFFLDVSSSGIFTAQRLAEFVAGGYPGIDVTFSLHTNIWFPWLPSPDPNRDALDFDNRPLANIHTPGLNAFLLQVKKLTLAMGGRWEYEVLFYKPMVLETGIDLQWQPPIMKIP